MVLSVPTPATRAAGTRLTGAIWQSDVTDTATFMLNPPIFLGIQSSVQSVGTGVWTSLTLDTTTVDTYAGHSNVTNSSRYTPTVPGWYIACGTSAFAANPTGSRGCRLAVNGTVLLGSGQLVGAGTLSASVASATRLVYLNGTTDYIEAQAGQNSGGALSTVNAAESACTLTLWWAHV